MPTPWSGPGIKHRTVVCGNAVLLMHGLHSIWSPPPHTEIHSAIQASALTFPVSRWVPYQIAHFQDCKLYSEVGDPPPPPHTPRKQTNRKRKRKYLICQERLHSSKGSEWQKSLLSVSNYFVHLVCLSAVVILFHAPTFCQTFFFLLNQFIHNPPESLRSAPTPTSLFSSHSLLWEPIFSFKTIIWWKNVFLTDWTKHPKVYICKNKHSPDR